MVGQSGQWFSSAEMHHCVKGFRGRGHCEWDGGGEENKMSHWGYFRHDWFLWWWTMCLLALFHFYIIKMGVRTTCSLSCLVGSETWKIYLLQFFKCLFFFFFTCLGYASVQFSRSVMSNSLWPQGLQHTRLSCPSPTPGACSNICPLSWWCHTNILSSVVPFSSCLQSFPVSGPYPVSVLHIR